MFRKALYAGTASVTASLCGIVAYCADKASSRRIVYDMTEDHIASLENHSDLELKFVQVFFRHGARTPLSELKAIEPVEWKSDEVFSGAKHTYIDYEVKCLDGSPKPDARVEKLYRNHKRLHGGAHIGQLTSVGMDHCYKLGQRLRQHYQYKVQLLPKTFNHQDFYFRSTNITRTIESLRCVVAGMCSPLKGPVDIFVSKSEEEVLYPNSHHCPILRKFQVALYKNLDLIPGMKPHRLEMQELMGMSKEEQIDFVNIRDVVKAREAHSLFIPDFLSSRMDHIDKQACNVMTYALGGRTEGNNDRDVLQMNVGNLMHLIINKPRRCCK
ncbi:lysophosphatidic acid phosphatase type 6-like [Amphiura filiformis]|uniref:lysophosphatidic acid phosphatase type 6-like n=1 Tax=Amphiura filiformis TaxID=82378 RepID=UPI003B213926